jgi:hypothetical protein
LTGLRTRLGPAERDAHDAGQVSILRALHDRLDAAVAAAYGWPADLRDAEIVARVVALNAERVAEEAAGTVRWLRPEFQAPGEARRRTAAVQIGMPVAPTPAPAAANAWPKDDTPAQFIMLRAALSRSGPASAKEIARRFRNAPRGRKIPTMLQTLAALGQARILDDERYTA